jgi:V8-like Glu-specific endopeptidase
VKWTTYGINRDYPKIGDLLGGTAVQQQQRPDVVVVSRFYYDRYWGMDKMARLSRSAVSPPTRRMSRKVLGLAVALAACVGPLSGLKAREAASADMRMLVPVRPGIGGLDPRGRLDPDKGPWRAVGKLQVTSVNRRQTCTGTLVGTSTVLTAAHCVFNELTQRNFLPGSVHFLIGYNGSQYAGHAVGVKLETGPGFHFDHTRPTATAGSDWALIWLDAKLGSADRMLPIIDHSPEIGSAIMLGGYQQDHPLVLMADTECEIVGRAIDPDGLPLLQHNCTGTRGVSGAPLLIEQNGKWFVTGVDVLAQYGAGEGYGVVLDEVRKRL